MVIPIRLFAREKTKMSIPTIDMGQTGENIRRLGGQEVVEMRKIRGI